MIAPQSTPKAVIKYDNRISDELYALIAEEYLKVDKVRFLIELRTSGIYNFEEAEIPSLANTLDKIDNLLSIFKLSLEYQLI